MDIVEHLRDLKLHGAADEIESLRVELETERMRLAACGVAALGYFEGCTEEYTSASLQDTLRLYEENKSLREQLEQVTRERDTLVNALDQEMVVCHLGVFNHGDDPVKAIKELMLWSQGVGEYFAKYELAACQKDAERYRWLRDVANIDQWKRMTWDCAPRDMDAAIDAAMKEQKT